MNKIDLDTWLRRQQFEYFRQLNHPHFSLCANLDLTVFFPYVKAGGFSFTIAFLYLVTRAANAVPEFRLRIRGDEVVEHETVSPSMTVLLDNGLFSFCTVEYTPVFPEFALDAARSMEEVKRDPVLNDLPGRDDLLFLTVIPWVSFTSFEHPMDLHPGDCIPRISWGKYFEENGRMKMPLSVQAHHALMDGIHMGRLYTEVQCYLDHPASLLAQS
jgi:chloramphenicol O-acetyltransferase type A